MLKTTLAAALVGAALVSPTANAEAVLRGSVCSMLGAREVAVFRITPAKCTSKTVTNSVAKIASGTWGSLRGRTHLSVSISTYTSQPIFRFARAHLSTLPGRPKKINGIGDVAYESGGDGGSLAAINFLVGHTICAINMRTAAPLRSLAQFNALAKTIATKL